MKIFCVSLLIILVIHSNLLAQDLSGRDSLSLKIPPLRALIDSALRYSPLLKSKAISVDISKESLSIEKKKWMSYLFIEGATSYGLFDQVVISNLNTQGAESTGLLTKSEQIRYYGGVGMKIPISALASRRNETKIKKLGIEQARYDLQEENNKIKQLIIEEYYKLKYLEESMSTFVGIYQTMQISYMKAEKDLSKGQMKLNDFAMLASTVGKAKDDCSKAKNNFFAQYLKLQEIVGVSFGN